MKQSNMTRSNMKRVLLSVFLLLTAFSMGTTRASAENSEMAANADHTAPSYDLKAQSLVDLARYRRSLWTWPTRFRLTS